MTLGAGTRLGPYEILSPLGAGGMGEVYRARDPKLHRDVAIKILPEAVARDPERLARFQREAQLLAALNHSHIGGIHGLEEFGGVPALVLELVEGETLAERLAGGPIPAEEALAIAREMAEALEAAHEKGIVHRDLKPSNVMITPGGSVKVLDFGLAKALTGDTSSPDVSHSPTLTAQATQAGIVIGTAAFMSPEQARGKAVDRRSDIWSFGAVLYEMLAGKKAFDGETVSDTLAAVLRGDIDWAALPPDTPPAVRRVLRRCLERDPKMRFHDIADARIAMDELPEQAATAARAAPRWRRALPWVVAAISALVAAFAFLRSPRAVRTAPPLPPAFHLSKALEGLHIVGAIPLITPDGTKLVALGWSPAMPRGRLYVWQLERDERREVEEFVRDPGLQVLSPDSQSIAIVGEKTIRRGQLSGGSFVEIGKTPPDLAESAGCWTADGDLLLPRLEGGLVAVSVAGGDVRDATRTDGPGVRHFFPQLLPDGKTLLLTVARGEASSAALVGFSKGKADGPVREILADAEAAQFVAPAHIVFWRKSGALAVPFDLSTLTVTGPPAPVLDVSYDTSSYLAVSATGTLAFMPRQTEMLRTRLVWVARNGVETPLELPPRDYTDPNISPTGDRLVIAVREAQGPQHLWVHTFATGVTTRVTFDGTSHEAPVWTADGRRILYTTSATSPASAVTSISADGTGAPVRLSPEGVRGTPVSWAPDGKALAIMAWVAGFMDISLLHCDQADGKGPCRAEKLIATEASEIHPFFSPDGRLLAYVSDESGVLEVYVRSMGPPGKWQISAGGATEPRWSRDGKELFYRARGALMAVSVTASPVSFGAPRKLFDAPYVDAGGVDDYDVAPDGRFLFLKAVEGAKPLTLELVLNWPTELARLAPAKGTK